MTAGHNMCGVAAAVSSAYVRTAANHLKAQTLLLDEDVEAYVQRAEASQVGR